ncbi:TlpA family protein disulfide reductase, partial [Bacteroidota bacterium]
FKFDRLTHAYFTQQPTSHMFQALAIIIMSFWVCIANAQEFQFSGRIRGMADESIEVQLPEDWFGVSKKETIEVKNGLFSSKLAVPRDGWITLFYKGKERSIYVWHKGDSLSVLFDADFLDAELEVGGKAGLANGFMQVVKDKFGSKLSVAWLNEQAADATNIDALEMEIFALRNDVVSLLKNIESENAEDFSKQFKNHLGYFYYLSLFKFSAAKTAASKIPKATEVPHVLLDGIGWEQMNKATELESSFFRELLLEFVNYRALEAFDFMKFANKNATVQGAFNIARDNLVRDNLNYFVAASMLKHADAINPSLLRQMRKFLKEQENSEQLLSIVDSRLSEQLAAKDSEIEIVQTSVNRKPAAEIQLQGLNGKSFGLSDFKGKVVYVDVWASWCGPCRQQFPFAKELKAKFSAKEMKNIEFLYISIDSNEEAWRKAIEQLELEGTHGLSSGGWSSEVTQKMKVSSIPRYFIIDKKGNMVEENAPRPSAPELYDMLKNLIAQ